MFREGPYNNRLFLRIRTGYYIINPMLKVRHGETWINFYELIGTDLQKLYPSISGYMAQRAGLKPTPTLQEKAPTLLTAPKKGKQPQSPPQAITAQKKLKNPISQIKFDFDD